MSDYEFGAGDHPPCDWASTIVIALRSVETINKHKATEFYNIFAATSQMQLALCYKLQVFLWMAGWSLSRCAVFWTNTLF
jgi:hypothetical protein